MTFIFYSLNVETVFSNPLMSAVFFTAGMWITGLWMFGNLSDKKVEVLSVIREQEGSETRPVHAASYS